MTRSIPSKSLALAALLLASAANGPAFAQDAPAAEETEEKAAQKEGEQQPEDESNIVVEAEKIKGSVDTDIPPTLTLSDKDIEKYGAASIGELLSAIPQTRSGNSRGGGGGGGGFSGQPIFLLNGRRVSNPGEIFNIPPEALRRVEVYPEEVATKLGYSPDQRVINFIIKAGFASTSIDGDLTGPSAGGRFGVQAAATLFKSLKNGRNNFSARHTRDTMLTENERDIVQPVLGDQEFRSLLPKSETYQLTGLVSRTLKNGDGVTGNLQYNRTNSDGLNGRPPNGVLQPLQRDSQANTLTGGMTLEGVVRRWQWTFTLTGTYTATDSQVDRPTVTSVIEDDAAFRTNTMNALYSVSGSPFRMPAGIVTTNFRVGADRIRVKSRSEGIFGTQRNVVGRDAGSGRANIDIPLTSKKFGVLGAIGDISINGNFGYRDVSDFGGLYNYGYGASWKPFDGLSLNASYTAEDAAPTTSQLGNALITTPNVTFFDFVRGETVQILLTTGGNRLLNQDKRRDFKLGGNFVIKKDAVNLDVNYFRNRSRNPISDFPALTAAVESAFPGRAVRNAAGRLVALDSRPVNFRSTENESIRWGLSFFKQFKPPQGGFGFGGGGGGRSGGAPGTGPQGGGGRPQGGPPRGGGGGGRGGGGGGMGFGPGGSGGLFLSVYHNYRITDEAVIAPGVPIIDLLDGGTLGGQGGSPRHSIELEGGIFKGGKGVRISGAWRQATAVKSPGTPDLRFGSLATLSVRMFIDLGQQKALVKKHPFLKGSRVSFRLLNITNAIQKVRDENGLRPFRYQPGYVDPLGRVIEIGFRKTF